MLHWVLTQITDDFSGACGRYIGYEEFVNFLVTITNIMGYCLTLGASLLYYILYRCYSSLSVTYSSAHHLDPKVQPHSNQPTNQAPELTRQPIGARVRATMIQLFCYNDLVIFEIVFSGWLRTFSSSVLGGSNSELFIMLNRWIVFFVNTFVTP
jgi:hypothetical protein